MRTTAAVTRDGLSILASPASNSGAQHPHRINIVIVELRSTAHDNKHTQYCSWQHAQAVLLMTTRIRSTAHDNKHTQYCSSQHA